MATVLSKNDEINNLHTFFDVMELPKEEIDKRVDMAFEFMLIVTRLFTIAQASIKANGNVDKDYLIDYYKRMYNDVINGLGYDDTDDYVDYYIDIVSDSIIGVMEQEKANAFSESRAREIAQNDANAISNHFMFSEMKEQGYKTKRWETMRDERVRFNHIMADGQEVAIDEPFVVGASEMMYPMDLSLGASADEIINCRCSCTYYK